MSKSEISHFSIRIEYPVFNFSKTHSTKWDILFVNVIPGTYFNQLKNLTKNTKIRSSLNFLFMTMISECPVLFKITGLSLLFVSIGRIG